MPAQPFNVHVNPEDLVRQDLAPASLPSVTGEVSGKSGSGQLEHHGARDGKQAARQRSERQRSSRASGTGSGRSYAFRRS